MSVYIGGDDFQVSESSRLSDGVYVRFLCRGIG